MFEREKSFDTCMYKQPLRFDFYINNEYLIEYDGKQHFIESDQCEATHKWASPDIKIRDQIKNEWCKENNIPLIRIPYTHYKELKLEDLLLETSNFIVK